MSKNRSVGIVGCGWLGKPLSFELAKEMHVECFSRELTKDNSSFWQNDIVIIAINTKENYLKMLQKIATLTKPTCEIILMSSISVYREFDSDVNESAPITKASLIKEAEDLLLGLKQRVLILRLGGLMGEDRVAGRWKSAYAFSDGFVNYIHRDDAINIIKLMIKSGVNRGIYNLVTPLHPTRKEIHTKNSKKFGSEIGSFDGFSNRRVSSGKLIKELNYTFLHPNPLEFWD
ncbi:hypothetical protein [Sulfurimonas sp.]|jgi:nucleoside-diphosphate-sugar epimerase|uniref:hypothetical protein n=1 Tax=Sulfurimonas sp. TaxID=2022749 RepID=UPI0025FBACD5|nr:hypothetical protein [Sulfurimonas sp.]MCK9472169.1 hypothetical protein [Sulfurimonas sp.]